MTQRDVLLLKLREAYMALGRLASHGLAVTKEPSAGRLNPEIVEKYNRPDRLAPGWWNHITITGSEESLRRVFTEAEYLRSLGIGFDTGGAHGRRNWELDWSFRINHVNSADLENMSKRRTAAELIIAEIDTEKGD